MQLTNENARDLIVIGLMAGHGCTPQQAQQAADEWMGRFDSEAQHIARDRAIDLIESRANRVRRAVTRAGEIELSGSGLDAWRALMAAAQDIKEDQK